MGYGWIAAGTALVVLVAAAITLRERATVLGALSFVVPALFLVLALRSAPVDDRAAEFRIEGIAVPLRAAEGPQVFLGGSDLATRIADDARGLIIDRGSALPPVGLHVDEVGGVPQLRVTVAPGEKVLVGFRTEGVSDFPHANVVPLAGGETIVLCADEAVSRRLGCTERRLAIRRDADGFSVGECHLSGEATSFFQTQRRNIALLDLYHYEAARCVPKPIPAGALFWPRRSSDGSIYEPMRSFLLVDGEALYVALLDDDGLVRLEVGEPPDFGASPDLGASADLGASEETGAAAGAVQEPVDGNERSVSVPTGTSIDIEYLIRRVRVPFEALELERTSEGESYCEGYGADAKSLSHGRLCKRIKIFTPERKIRTTMLANRLLFEPLGERSITVSTGKCENGCSLEDLRAAYRGEASSRRSNPDVPLLQFPLGLIHGEPLNVAIGFRDNCLGSESCVEVAGHGAVRQYPVGRVLALGRAEGEQHFVRVSLFDRPLWLGVVLVALFALQAWALRPSRPALIAVLAGVQTLIAARALFGFKIMTRFPHDAEGLTTAVVAAAWIPIALGLASERPRTRGAIARIVFAALIGGATVAVLALRGMVPIRALDVIVGVFMIGLGAVASWIRRATWRKRVSQLLEPKVVLWLAPLIALILIGVRLYLTSVGRERAFGVPVIAWYWPSAVIVCGLLLGWVVEAFRGKGGVRWLQGRSVTLAVATVFVALILGLVGAMWGDKGAMLVLAPVLCLGIVVAWAPEFRLLTILVGVGIVVAVGGSFLAHVFIDDNFPPLDGIDRAWEVPITSPIAREHLCPPPAPDRVRPLDISPYSAGFRESNVWIRIQDYLVPGIANRAGTRAGAEVHESLSVMRRYAAGSTESWEGCGYLQVDVRRYGRAEVDAQLFDGAPSVLLASEGGSLAVFGLALLHVAMLAAFLREHEWSLEQPTQARAVVSFIAISAAAIPAWTTLFMLGGNFGLLPFTGQSTPLLSLLSGTDAVLPAALWMMALLGSRIVEES